MTITLICHLQTPQDDRFSASGIVTPEYTGDEGSSGVRSDARFLANRGQKALDELVEEGYVRVTSRIDQGCRIPEGFPVTIKMGESTQTVKPSY